MPRPTFKTDISVRNTILSRFGPWQAVNVMVSAADVVADADGKKILKAGTFLGSALSGQGVLKDSAKVKAVNGAETEGLLVNDVEVTHGDMEAAMLYMGTVGLDRIPEAPVAATLTALPRVTFTKD